MTDRSPSPLPPSTPDSHIQRPLQTHVSPPRSVAAVNIFRDTLLVTEGRDKVVKLLQYASRLILLLSSAPSKRLRPFVSQMSMTRKVLKLGHGVFPYLELTQQGAITKFALIRAIVEIINDFWDDVYCLSRIGLLRSKRLQTVSEIWANRAWMMGILMDLNVLMERKSAMTRKLKAAGETNLLRVGVLENQEQRMRRKLRAEAYWIDVSIVKLLADFAFCCIFPARKLY